MFLFNKSYSTPCQGLAYPSLLLLFFNHYYTSVLFFVMLLTGDIKAGNNGHTHPPKGADLGAIPDRINQAVD